MKPSNFTNFPYGSTLQKTEAEIVACNIMKILERTGDTFRNLTWDEYKQERLRDKGFSVTEKSYFNQVIPYCKTSDTAVLFSPEWNN